MTLHLGDVFVIPDVAGAEDYVLRLSDSVGAAASRTIRDYVVTPQLAQSFDTALTVVAGALKSGTSAGAWLKGSFGSGKSHFMAVLHAVLSGNTDAWSKTELQPVLAHHQKELHGANLLGLTFHLLGAESLEQAIFKGYITQIRALHPGAALPPLHLTDGLLADADGLRVRLGDKEFFAALNGGDRHAKDEWSGVLDGTWAAAAYDRARAADHGDDDRTTLVSALVDAFYTAFPQTAGYVGLDEGLALLASHAKSLGYDGVVLFLDELVLWLAFGVQSTEFFKTEAQKITKLVEDGLGKRDIPLISFISRQIDLRKWFADAGASGQEQAALDQAFAFQEGRLTSIQLGDDNLPHVAHKRLLQPKDAAAAQHIADAFAAVDRHPRVWDVLLGGGDEGGVDEQAFRLTYPFSPALIATLRHLASAMQRERTALKVMQQMLVDRRDTMPITEIVPVGDAFEYLVTGQGSGAAINPQISALFQSADKLYREKVRPLLLRNNNLTELDVAAGGTVNGFRGQDRLAKTLLLAAIAPGVPALKALTARRLAALNHGSMHSPLPQGEAQMVLSAVRSWTGEIPEIQVDAGDDPLIRVQLDDVDWQSVMDRAKSEDNAHRRRRLITDLIREDLGISGEPDMTGAFTHTVVWRGSKREVDVVFGNVRDSASLSDDQFQARPGTWRLVIDHPFDEQGHSTAEDVQRLDNFIARGMRQQTVVWLPHFLGTRRQRELGELVILQWLLDAQSDRFSQHADHLSETDRHVAKSILETKKNTLLANLRTAVLQAYGAAALTSDIDVFDRGHRVLASLDNGLGVRKPVGATLREAFDHVVEQAYSSSYPDHPQFEPGDKAITVAQLKMVHDHLVRAAQHPEGRVQITGSIRDVQGITKQLQVGLATEVNFLFQEDRFQAWNKTFEQGLGARSADHQAPVTVAEMREWLKRSDRRHGLRQEVADLVILAWGLLRRRAWYLHGSPLPTAPAPGTLTDQMELRTTDLPTESEWQDFRTVAGQVFGTQTNPYLTPDAVARAVDDVHGSAQALTHHARQLVAALDTVSRTQPAAPGSQREQTARVAAHLVERLSASSGVALIRILTQPEYAGKAPVVGRSLRAAADCVAALGAFNWSLVSSLRDGANTEGALAVQAAALVTKLEDAIAHDELVIPLAPAIASFQSGAVVWLQQTAKIATPAASAPVLAPLTSPGSAPTFSATSVDEVDLPILPTPVKSALGTGRRTLNVGDDIDSVIDELRAFRDAHADHPIDVQWSVRE